MSSQFSLLSSRRFGPFFGTQFLGAFNDNLFKNALLVLLTFQTAQWTTLKPELLVNLAAGIFILPFFLFSATAGQLADKYDKAKLTRLVKVLEIVIILIAGVGFWLRSLTLLMIALFLLGLHSTLFGPVKYAILPQHLRKEEIVGGNALIEAGTFVAILVGTLAGGLLAGIDNGIMWIPIASLAIAVAGYAASCGVPSAPAPEPNLVINPNPISETWRNIGFARENRTVFLSILGISWFWLFGALMLAQFPAYAKNVLFGSESSVTLLLTVFTLGIGLGSLLCERLSERLVEIGLVPLGSIGITLFGLDLALISPAPPPLSQSLSIIQLLSRLSTFHVLFDLFAIGLFGGFFIVPLYALMQIRSSENRRARIVAANNIMNALFMVIGAVVAAGLLTRGLTIPQLFGVAALCNAAVALYIYRLLPEFLIRFVIWLLIRFVYRLEKRGVEAIPDEGAAIIVSNHASYVDSLIIAAVCRRPIRIVLDRRYFHMPGLSYLLRHGRAIPFDANEEGAALNEISGVLADGQLVAIFPEGDICEDGRMRDFQPWIDTALANNKDVPVVPLALAGLWGGLFSRCEKSLVHRLMKLRLFQKITVVAGEPLAAGATSSAGLAEEVRRLGEDAP